MFFWNSLAFSKIQWMLAIWPPVPLPFLNPAENSQFTYCWNLAWSILSLTLLHCEMSAIVWYFEQSLALPFLGIEMKTDLFRSCCHCWVLGIANYSEIPLCSCENGPDPQHQMLLKMWNAGTHSLLVEVQNARATWQDRLAGSYITKYIPTIWFTIHSLIFMQMSWKLMST